MISQLMTGMTTAYQAVGLRAVDPCPAAPDGVQGYANQILGWVKWGSLTMMGIAFFAAIGMMVWGRITYHPRGARLGFDGLMITLVSAVIYVSGWAVIHGITNC